MVWVRIHDYTPRHGFLNLTLLFYLHQDHPNSDSECVSPHLHASLQQTLEWPPHDLFPDVHALLKSSLSVGVTCDFFLTECAKSDRIHVTKYVRTVLLR